MFHIILLILKIFGIILLSILGFFVFLILIILFVPIWYKLDAEKRDRIQASANVSWLFRLLYIQITFIDNKFRMRLRLLGKVIIDSDKPKEKVKRDVKKVSKRIEKKVSKRVEEEVEEQAEEQTEEPAEKLTNGLEEHVLDKKNSEDSIKLEKSEERMKISQEIMQDDDIYDDEPSQDNKSDKKQRNHKPNIFCKIKIAFQAIISKIKEFLDTIKNILIKVKEIILNLKNKIIGMQAIWQKCRDFLQNETNKAAIKHIFISLRKMLRHIRPLRVRIQMEFGTGDPCQTGQALGAAALLYGYYGEAIKITPNFETEIYEGTLFLKGRIRLFTLLIICIKLILDKNFRQFIKNSKALKEEL